MRPRPTIFTSGRVAPSTPFVAGSPSTTRKGSYAVCEKMTPGQGALRSAGAVDEVPCLVGWFFARVMANGEVVPCCRAVMRPMGSLHAAPFAQIWRSAPYAEFRRHADESKAHGPYFKDIGCVTSCDNLMHNIEWHRLVEGDA